jgi:hypothetical protein
VVLPFGSVWTGPRPITTVYHQTRTNFAYPSYHVVPNISKSFRFLLDLSKLCKYTMYWCQIASTSYVQNFCNVTQIWQAMGHDNYKYDRLIVHARKNIMNDNYKYNHQMFRIKENIVNDNYEYDRPVFVQGTTSWMLIANTII